jgi:hypothetical protein
VQSGSDLPVKGQNGLEAGWGGNPCGRHQGDSPSMAVRLTREASADNNDCIRSYRKAVGRRRTPGIESSAL